MAKTLLVVSPVFDLDEGDSFEYDDVAGMYVTERNQELHKSDDSNSEVRAIFNSSFAISADYAKELIRDGVLEEANNDSKPFKNVFDEIEGLISKYENELKNLNEDMASFPECMKVERTTVLNNLLSMLDYLKGLKK